MTVQSDDAYFLGGHERDSASSVGGRGREASQGPAGLVVEWGLSSVEQLWNQRTLNFD
jgi:hypothetical protein